MQGKNQYTDIINMPHHISRKHPQMSLYARSAQFAPFAALTGYGEAVEETERVTDNKREIDEELKTELDRKIQWIKGQIKNKPKVTFTYFIPDRKKDGGSYQTITGVVEKIDEYNEKIILDNEKEIYIDEVIDINIEIGI
ncbi:MAG: hypothetical protein IKF17_01575 [Clostridia bacterium]|nr:hypothetical protein [Clostridia bacterium]